MQENATPPGANALVIALMPKEAIMEALTKAYTDAKPLNDAVVDASLRVAALTTEVYRRSIRKQLPDIPITRRRTVMRVETKIHPNHGLPKIAQRLAEFEKEGIVVTEVEYDENTGMYSFYAAPEFDLQDIPTAETGS